MKKKQPPTLDTIERQFRSAILEGNLENQEFLSHLTYPERLDAYVQGYPARVQDILEEIYPAVCRVIGEHNTHMLAHEYASRNLSHTYNLNRLGGVWQSILKIILRHTIIPFW